MSTTKSSTPKKRAVTARKTATKSGARKTAVVAVAAKDAVVVPLKTVNVYDWKKIPNGSLFTGIVDGKKMNGRIAHNKNNHEVFICQNDHNDGSNDGHAHGITNYEYKYTYCLGNVNYAESIAEEMENATITLDPTYKVGVPLEVGDGEYQVEMHKDGKHVEIGCQTVTFAQVEIVYNRMRQLQGIAVAAKRKAARKVAVKKKS